MKKTIKNLFTILAIGLLAVAIPIAIYILQNQQFDFQINALLSDQPRNVFIVNVRGSSAEILWDTEKKVIGAIRITNIEDKIYIEEESSSYHLIKVSNLQPGGEYPFVIISDGVEYSDPAYVIRTATLLDEVSSPFIIYGQIFNELGTGFQSEGMLLAQIDDNGNLSQKVPAILNKAGGYQIDLSGLLKDNLSSEFNYEKTVNVILNIYFDIDQDPIQKIFTLQLNSNKQVPNIFLGDINIDEIPGVNGN